MSFAFESFRATVEGREEQRSRLPETVVTIALLAVFELFILGLHATISLLSQAKLHAVSHLILGPALAGASHTQLNLVIMVLLWVSVAVVLTLGLAFAVFDRGCELPATYSWRDAGLWAKPTARAGLIGALVGGVGGPLSVLGYTLCVRALAEVRMILFDAGTFTVHLAGVEERVRSFVPAFLALPVTALAWLFASMTSLIGAPWGPVLALAVSAGFAALCIWIATSSKDGRFLIPALVVVVAYAVPLFGGIRDLFKLTIAVASVWAFPGVALGAMVPWLSRPSRSPRIWGFVAFGASAVLFLFARLTPPHLPLASLSLAGAAVIFVAVGLLFQRGGAIERYWPILALSVAINVFGLTRLVQGADFFNIQKEAYFLSRSPLLTLQPRPKRFADFATAADLARWRSPLFGPLGDPTAAWRHLPPSAFRFERLTRVPSSVLQARGALKARVGEMTSVQNTMADRAEALRRSLDDAHKEFKESARLSLRDQEAQLLKLETDTRRLLATTDAVATELERHLGGELVRPIPEESPSWPSPIPFDLTDEWTATLRKEQRDFTAARQTFESRLRDHAAAVSRARDALTHDLHDLAEAREQVHDQIASASLLELAMTASLGFWATIGILTGWAIRHGTSHRDDAHP